MLGRLPSSQLRADKPFCDPASLSGNPLVSGRSSTNDNPIVSLTGSSDISDCCPCQFESHFECTSGKIAGGAIAISYGLPRLLADTNRQRGNKFLKQAFGGETSYRVHCAEGNPTHTRLLRLRLWMSSKPALCWTPE